MGRSFVAWAFAIACLCVSNEASAQEAPLRLDATIMKLGYGERPFQRPNVKTYRKRDSTIDGLIKGALFGVVIAVTLEKGLDAGAEFGPREWATIVAISTGTGYAVDALHTYRQPIRPPGFEPPATDVKFKLRF